MTTFLWILAGGFILGIVFAIIFSFSEKTKTLSIISICISFLSVVFFLIDITVEPVKNVENATNTQTNEITYIEGVDYSEIYKDYKQNELRADDKYKNNRYRITAKVDGMTKDGFLNFDEETTVTMELNVDNTIVIFYATFEKDQEEALKSINVGDTITFEGECLSAGSWSECKLIK